MLSGYIVMPLTNGSLRAVGLWGYEWSLRASASDASGASAPSAYYAFFDTTSVLASGGPSPRYVGRPLRCLSTVLGM